MLNRIPVPDLRKLTKRTLTNPKRAAMFYAAIIVTVYFMWFVTQDIVKNATLFGIPLGFVLPVLVLPFFTLIILDGFARKADDIDRHNPETENEQ